MKPDRSLEEPLELIETDRGGRRYAGPLQDLGPISRVGGDRERLLEEADRQVMRSEGGGPLRRALERDPRLGGQGVALWALGSVVVRRGILARERPCQFVRAETFE